MICKECWDINLKSLLEI